MQEYDLNDLRSFLEKVRGETRVKTKEEAIRNQFLQSAVDEIFEEHDWVFNRRREEIEITSEGYYEAPSDFSPFNDYYMEGANGRTYQKRDGAIDIEYDGSSVLLSGPTEETISLVYYIAAPDMIANANKKVRFPRPMLIAERAYVRLKTAYFPDETSEKEEARSLRMVRELAMRDAPRPSFKLKSWS